MEKLTVKEANRLREILYNIWCSGGLRSVAESAKNSEEMDRELCRLVNAEGAKATVASVQNWRMKCLNESAQPYKTIQVSLRDRSSWTPNEPTSAPAEPTMLFPEIGIEEIFCKSRRFAFSPKMQKYVVGCVAHAITDYFKYMRGEDCELKP